MTRTFEEMPATTADDSEYNAQNDDKKTTHAADYHNSLNRHFSRHCNDNNDHSMLLPQVNNDDNHCNDVGQYMLTNSIWPATSDNWDSSHHDEPTPDCSSGLWNAIFPNNASDIFGGGKRQVCHCDLYPALTVPRTVKAVVGRNTFVS